METIKKIFLMALLLCSGLGAWADNNIILSNVQGTAGTEVTVSVSMTNTDAVSAIQLSIPLDENLTFVENSQQSGSRISGHTLSAGVKDGVLNILVYSVSMAAISGNEGDVCSFKLLLGNNPGIANLVLSKAALTGTDGSSLAVATTAGTVDVRGAKAKLNNSTLDFGRVAINGSLQSRSVRIENVGNETLTISDISFSSPVFSTTTTLPMTVNSGSSGWIYVYCKPMESGILDEEMTITSNNVTGNITIRLKATSYGANELTLQSVSGMIDEEVTIPIIMKNYNEINGIQLELQLPKELEYVDGSFNLSDRKQDHVAVATFDNDRLVAVAYSPTDKSFNGNDGEVGSFKVKILGGESVFIWIDKAFLSATIDGKSVDVLSDTNYGRVTVKSPYMYTWSNLDFGKISINEEDIQELFTIWNYGDAPLVVSNIAFGNGLFHIQEQLPLTIEASSNKKITVICDATEDGDISTNMEIYSNDPNKRLYLVNVTGEIYSPNYLSGVVEDKSDEVDLDISLNNYSDIYGIQFDVNTTKDFTASANDVILTERGNNMSVSINSIGEGKLRVVAYAKNGQFVSSGEGKVMTIKLVPNETLPDGEYTMTLSNILLGSKDMRNIYAGQDVTIKFGVGAPVVITAKSYTRAYGEANPTFEYTVEGATLDGTPEITCEATGTSPVGTYDIVVKQGTVTNYNVTYVAGTLTVTKAPLSIAAGTYTKKQGEAMPEFTLTYTGFKNNETKDVLVKQPEVSCQANEANAPGEYPVIVSGAEAQNYDISYTNGKLIVTNADLVTVTAKSYIREYGEANPTFEYTTEGAELVGQPEITCEATETSPAGTYDIVVKQGTVKNYNVTYVAGKLTITKSPLTIAAGTYTKKQGEAMPEFTLTYTGFKNNETKDVLTKQPTVNCNATEGSAPGEYPVIVSGAEAQNYDISYTDGKLIVVDADAIVIKAMSYTREYGETNPGFEYTVEGEDLDGTPEITCEATETSPVGTYNIIVNKGTVTNYNVSYVAGTLTITKAPLTVKVDNATREQGKVNPEFVISYDGWKNGEDESVLITMPVATTEASADSPVGEYAIVVSGAEAQNYELSYVNGILTITESTGIMTISADHPVDVYDLQGNKVRSQATTLKGLTKGLYIVNGRKMVLK